MMKIVPKEPSARWKGFPQFFFLSLSSSFLLSFFLSFFPFVISIGMVGAFVHIQLSIGTIARAKWRETVGTRQALTTSVIALENRQ